MLISDGRYNETPMIDNTPKLVFPDQFIKDTIHSLHRCLTKVYGNDKIGYAIVRIRLFYTD